MRVVRELVDLLVYADFDLRDEWPMLITLPFVAYAILQSAGVVS